MDNILHEFTFDLLSSKSLHASLSEFCKIVTLDSIFLNDISWIDST